MYLGTAYPRADGTVGTFSWTIPTTMQSGSNYQIQFINGTTSVGKSLSFTITSTTSTQPSITVGYPNGGETVLLGASGGGNDFRTTWTSSNLSGSVSIYLNFADGGTCLLGTAPVSQGYFLTTLGSNYQCSNISRSVTPGQYKVLLNTDTRDTDPNSLFGIHDTSDNYFTIATAGMVCGGGAVVGTTQACNAGLGVGVQTCQANGAWSSCVVSAQPSITVTSPNGGESWTQGGTYNIRWTSNGVSNVMIVLENSNTSNGWHLNYSVPASAGLYSWTVPSSVAAGSGYKITIWDNTSSSIIDSSNNTFTIATSGAICTPGITMACNAGAGAGTQTCNSSGQWGSCVVNQLPIIVNVTANGSAGPIIPVQIGSLISIAWTSTGDAETCSVSATPEDSSINLWYTGSSGSISVHQGAPITTYTVNCYKGINTANVQQGFNSITLQTSSASACTGTAPSAGQILCPGTDQSISAPWHEVGDGLNNCCGVAGHPCNQCSYYTPAIIMKYPTK
jgi:hypothetical protein